MFRTGTRSHVTRDTESVHHSTASRDVRSAMLAIHRSTSPPYIRRVMLRPSETWEYQRVRKGKDVAFVNTLAGA